MLSGGIEAYQFAQIYWILNTKFGNDTLHWNFSNSLSLLHENKNKVNKGTSKAEKTAASQLFTL